MADDERSPVTVSRPGGARETSSPFTTEYRTLTIGMVVLVALGAFESLAVSTAMPTVATELGGMALYTTAFAGPLASSVVGMTLAGHWADRRGPVAPLLVGVGLFIAGLVVAGFAPTMLVLVGGRIVQGVGSGLYSVVLYVVIARVYPDRVRPRVFSALAAAWVVPGIVGPFVAGLVVEHIGWRWVFLAVPILAVPAVLALRPALTSLRPGPDAPTGPEAGSAADRATPEASDPVASTRPATTRAGRYAVMFALVTAVGVLGLHHGGQADGAERVSWIVVGLAAVGLGAPRLLPRGTMRAAPGLPSVIAIRGLLSAAFFGAEVFLPLLLQTHHGLRPAAAGAVLTFGAVTWSLGSWARGRGLGGWGDATWLRGGALLIGTGIGFAALLVVPDVPVALGFVGWAVAGLGMGVAFPTLSLLTLRLSAPHEQGVNSAALQVMDSVTVALTLALSGALFTALGGPVTVRSFVAGFAVAASSAVLAAALPARVGRRPAPVAPPGREALTRDGRAARRTSRTDEEQDMGIDDLVNKAKDALSGHEDQAKSALDKAADAVKTRTSDQHDAVVDDVVAKAKGFLDEQGKPGTAR